MKNLYNPRTVVDADVQDQEESHDCGSGDYNVTCWLADGTVLEMCECFGDDCDMEWDTLKNMEGPVAEPLNYPRWMRKKCRTTSDRIRRAVHLAGGTWLSRKRAVFNEFRSLGKPLYLTGAFRCHMDGDGISAVWRWWHPVSWIAFFVGASYCVFSGEKVQDVVPFTLSDYWKENKENLEWI